METMVDRLTRQLGGAAKTLAELDPPLRSQWVVELLIMLEREVPKDEDYDFRGTLLGVIQNVAQLMESELHGYDPHTAEDEYLDF